MKTMSYQILLAAYLAFFSVAALAESDCDKAFDDGSDKSSFVACEVQATSGDRKAQFGFAQILMFGVGREHHGEQAVDWYRRSAKQRYFLAQVVLGRLLSDKRFAVDLNEVEAYAWWSVSKDTSANAELWSRLNAEQREAAVKLANEYVTKYAATH